MTVAPRSERHTVALAVLVAALVFAAAVEIAATIVSAGSEAKDVVTGTAPWRWLMPFAIAAAITAIGWVWHAGRRAVAGWIATALLGTALYDISATIYAITVDDPAASPLLFAVGNAGIALWMTGIAALQLAAIALAAPSWRRLSRIFAIVSLAVVAFSAAMPADTGGMPALVVIGAVAYYSWAALVIAIPVVLWIGVARTSGTRRVVGVRAAVGVTIPLLVVMLCGVLAATARGAEDNLEGAGLALGFALAVAITPWWLVASTLDTAPGAHRRFTTLAAAVQVGLWAFYGLAIIQIALPIGLAISPDAPATPVAIATVGVGAAAFRPWQRLVSWCAANVAPRRSLITRLLAADRELSRSNPLALAERVVRAARLGTEARVLVVLPDGRWIDRHGIRTQDPDPTVEGTSLVRDERGVAFAAIVDHEPEFDLDPVLIELRPVLYRGALEAELHDNAERLEQERERADRAADEERRRLERDLHDGVQARLLSLGLNLGMVADGLDDPGARLALSETVDGLRDAVSELRTLASGRLPATLARGGLRPALEELLAPVPLEISLTVPEGRLGHRAESVAYFVVAEAVSNALKHASAKSVDIRLARDGSILTVTVEDDGFGGADPRAGTGLRGLGERVHGAGGRLLVSELQPHGTQLEATVPCG